MKKKLLLKVLTCFILTLSLSGNVLAQKKYDRIMFSKNPKEIEAFLETANPSDPRVFTLKQKLNSVKNNQWMKGTNSAFRNKFRYSNLKPKVKPGTNIDLDNSSEAVEFKKLYNENADVHKQKTVKLLNALFDQDENNKDAILMVQNNSDCNMILRVNGTKKYNIAIPAKGEASMAIARDKYEIKSKVCGKPYTSVKDITENQLIALDNSSDQDAENIAAAIENYFPASANSSASTDQLALVENTQASSQKKGTQSINSLSSSSGGKQAVQNTQPAPNIVKAFANANEEQEFKKLMADNDDSHKEKTVKLLNALFDQDVSRKDAIVMVQNNSDCNIIVRFQGKDNYNLAVPAHGENSVVVMKGQYSLTSNVCGARYFSTKSIFNGQIVALKSSGSAKPSNIAQYNNNLANATPTPSKNSANNKTNNPTQQATPAKPMAKSSPASSAKGQPIDINENSAQKLEVLGSPSTVRNATQDKIVSRNMLNSTSSDSKNIPTQKNNSVASKPQTPLSTVNTPKSNVSGPVASKVANQVSSTKPSAKAPEQNTKATIPRTNNQVIQKASLNTTPGQQNAMQQVSSKSVPETAKTENVQQKTVAKTAPTQTSTGTSMPVSMKKSNLGAFSTMNTPSISNSSTEEKATATPSSSTSKTSTKADTPAPSQQANVNPQPSKSGNSIPKNFGAMPALRSQSLTKQP